MARTLIVSDLHIGASDHRSVVERPVARARLLEAISPGDRLILLGDTIELARLGGAGMRLGSPIMRELGARVGAGGQIVVVPGNHDHLLLGRWARAQGAALDRDGHVPADASDMLKDLVDALAVDGAEVEVRYPGFWLDDRTWATHGHYAGAFGRGPRGRTPAAYERRTELPLSRLGRLLRPWMAPLTVSLLDQQLRRRTLRSIMTLAGHLGVDAEYLIFGHIHRLGPLPQDDPAIWSGPAGRPQVLNTGSWRYDPLLLHRAGPDHRYWPGGAVVIEPGASPRAIQLLVDLTATELAPHAALAAA